MSATDTDTGIALLAAILDNPGDNAVRLVYADWLEENGDSHRSEFIRLQVQRHAEGADHVPPVAKRCYCLRCRRERQLLLEHLRDWVPYLSPGNSFEVILSETWTYAGKSAVKFARGFAAEVHCPQQVWLDHGKEIASRHPIERVVLADKRPWTHTYPPGGGCWSIKSGDPVAHIDPEIHRRLRGYTQKPGNNPDWFDYPSQAVALAALSVACLAYAKGDA